MTITHRRRRLRPRPLRGRHLLLLLPLLGGLPLLAAGPLPAEEPASPPGGPPVAEEEESELSIEETAFRAILSDDELKEYRAVAPARRAEWRRRFWRRIDPDPTTARNERLEEHGARLARARELFARGGVLEWDDRCAALLRYGEPLVRYEDGGEVHSRGGLDPPRERWLYEDRFLYMEDRNLDGRFLLGISSVTTHIGRAEGVGERDAFVREGAEPPVDRVFDFEDRPEVEAHFPDFSRHKLAKMLENGRRDWSHQPREYVSPRTGKEIPFVFDLNTFQADSGLSDVVVNYLIPLESLASDEEGVWIERRTVIIDDAEEVAGSDVQALEQPVGAGDRAYQWILNSASVAVPPGRYLVASRVTDLVSPEREMGLLRADADVPDYGRGLQMSDVMFGAAVEEVEEGAPRLEGVIRRGWRIIPTPVRQYNRLTKPHLYFEVYNLTPGPDGRYKYRVEYVLTKQEPRGFLASIKGIFSGRLSPGIATAFERETSTPDVDNWIAIDTEELPADTYFIETRITDLHSGAETSRRESFIIQGEAG